MVTLRALAGGVDISELGLDGETELGLQDDAGL